MTHCKYVLIFTACFLVQPLYAQQCMRPQPSDQRAAPQSPSPHNPPPPHAALKQEHNQPCSQGGVASMGSPTQQPDNGLGNPVHVLTGIKHQYELDLPEPITFRGLSFGRYYRSHPPNENIWGVSWQSEYDTRLYRPTPSNVLHTIVQADGLRHTFKASGVNTWQGTSTHSGTLTQHKSRFVWRWPNAQNLIFNSAGYLIRIEQPQRHTAINIHYHQSAHDSLKKQGLIDHIDLVDMTTTSNADRLVPEPFKPIDQIRFTYEDQIKQPIKIKSIQTRAGIFRYDFQATTRGWQIKSMQRPDGMVRHYHYEESNQAQDRRLLTGLSISATHTTPAQRVARWFYNQRAHPATVNLPHATRWPQRHRQRLTPATFYNEWGRPTLQILPEGGKLTYYWAFNRLLSIDWTDRHHRTHTLFEAHAAGIKHGNGLLTSWHATPQQFDVMVYQPILKHPVYQHRMQINATRQVTSENSSIQGIRHTQRYRYDALGRLIQSRQTLTGFLDAQETVFGWQPNGLAAWQFQSATGRYSLSPLWKHTQSHTLSNHDVYSAYAHPTHYHHWQLSYNRTGHVVRAQSNRCSACWIKWTRRPDGSLLSRQTPTSYQTYEYDQHRQTAVYARKPFGLQIMQRFIFANEVLAGIIDYQYTPPRLLHVHTDPLGLPRLVTDDKQGIVWQAWFTPHGQLIKQQGELSVWHRYPGQTHDPDIGWHDNYQRIYDPQWGHYLQADPLGPNQVATRFGYAAQQPRRYVDPLGLMLFAFDGTGNDQSTLTNVWKFSQQYQDGPIHYLPGPGRAIGPEHKEDATDVAIAWSAGQRVAIQWQRLLQALSQLKQSTTRTPIDVVGFSRGAALARHFVNQVAQHVRAGRFWYEHPVMGQITACVDLRFLGLFDTVAQFHLLGLTDQKYDLGIPSSWRFVSHAVALHEFRWTFPLTAAVGAQVNEKAFVGAHADIGGGYLTPTASPGSTPGDLSEVALRWMFGQAQMAGVDITLPDQAATQMADSAISVKPVIHDESKRYRGVMAAKDRRVGDKLQGEIAHMGQTLRQEVESFIKRPSSGSPLTPDFVNHWADDVAGWVEMGPYLSWLKQRVTLP